MTPDHHSSMIAVVVLSCGATPVVTLIGVER
jgi:hypothetical protein